MISEHAAHLTPLPFGIRTWLWRYTCLFFVNFDALAQASYFRIERRQVVLLYWMQVSNSEGLWNAISSRLNARWQTDWAKLEIDSPSLWSANIQPTWPPGRRQAIIWTNAVILLIEPLQTSVRSQSKFTYFHFRKCIWICRLENVGHLVSVSMC